MDAKRRIVEKEISPEVMNTKVWLDDLEAEQDRLSNYEKDAVADMQDSFAKYGRLTDRRYEKLQQLHNKYF